MPSVTQQATPPVLRTQLGEQFCKENLGDELILQQCSKCCAIQYPPRERCRQCLADSLVWRKTNNTGTVLSVTFLHHSQGEFFLSKIKTQPWPLAIVSLGDQCVFVHLASATFSSEVVAGNEIRVFTYEDASGRPVLIGASPNADISQADLQNKIAQHMGLVGKKK